MHVTRTYNIEYTLTRVLKFCRQRSTYITHVYVVDLASTISSYVLKHVLPT